MSESPIDPHAHHHAHCLPFGAQLIGATAAKPRTRFRFWAPSCKHVQVEIENGPAQGTHDMTPAGNGWFEASVDSGAGTLYRFRLDGERAVPDPASRFQPQDVHGPSEVIDPRAYRWEQTNWHGRPWEETVLYELHVGTLGGYAGVQKRLSELAALGVTAIELMPLNDFSGTHNWGYDGVLPYAPDSAYGRPEDLKALIDAAHGLGLMVFLDVVYNHFGPDGNYLHEYARSFFREGTHTPWGPAIDFERSEVSDFFTDNAVYWINEYRIDGLRFDAVHAIDNHAWLRELSDHIRAKVQHGRHVHLVLENEHNSANLLETHFDAQWNDDAHNTLHVLLTGETEGYYHAYEDQPIRRLARVLSEGFAYQGDPSPIHDGKPRGEASTHLPPTSFVMFLQNHDQIGNRAFGERLRKLTSDEALRAATGLLLLSPQIPLLFMGEEYGSTQPFLFFTDYTGDLADAVREGRRREFARFSSFSDEKRRAQIPDPNDVKTFATSSPPAPDETSQHTDDEAKDRLDWMHFYKSALTVRAKLITPRLKHSKACGVTVLSAANGGDANALIARWKLADGETLSIALNLSKENVALADLPAGKVIFETPPRVREQVDVKVLPAHAFVAWLTGDVSDYAIHHDARIASQQERHA
ncbi:malto-oligosyltrehalose trehalohydrolase [Burkholderia sp. Ch1-1]|uniref:Malto-oligosyltrehalose trehalohydrolase n=1 Tax=Paraburkholderia dioscoreae TaxID=2604047 RepID=A0A5Q4ZHW2_9BURK|nr:MULTISPECIES: malto-oligosyltrehalose trehalohydrolase [Paraburkholderia]EIF35587.1 malto-oligosyltrehalose trehalohydrolase [Burkholderia sp. Ch1-1]MDR8400028.1 malto-oligosyltrehalose trehalohydrolase [Paraburkholderia sp. USG1]VVD31491.1 Malto-oligosyltrehalose trehalohydrolase [Paraburkholderia dioscoreae]